MEHIEKILLPNYILEQLVKHAEATKPYEAVAIIAGFVEGVIAHSEIVYTPVNTDRSRISFTIDPLVLLDIYNEVEKLGKQIIAIYHTHPAPPSPSSTDLEYMEVNPYVWLISSLTSPDQPKGYILLKNNTLKDVEVEIIKI
jgi:proteasome lid subunit RPN8/RPN11